MKLCRLLCHLVIGMGLTCSVYGQVFVKSDLAGHSYCLKNLGPGGVVEKARENSLADQAQTETAEVVLGLSQDDATGEIELPFDVSLIPDEQAPPSAAGSLYSSAKAAQQHDDLDAAEKYFQQSLSISEKLVPGSLAVARTLNGLGDVAQRRGRPPEAEGYYQRALTIIQKLDPASIDTANSLDGLARVAMDRRDLVKFEEYALQGFSIREKLDSNSLDFSLGLNNIALLYVRQKQLDKAEEAYRKALTIQERLAPESLALAETLNHLGDFFCLQRQHDQGDAYHRRALEIRRNVAPDSMAVAESLRSLGSCTRDDPAEKEKYYRAALSIEEKLAPGNIHIAWTLNYLAGLAENRGDLKAAESYARQELAILEKLAPGDPLSRAVKIFLGDLLTWRGDLNGAEEFGRKALEENRKLDPASRGVVGGLFILGNVAMQRGDLVAADGYYHQALEISEKVDPGGSLPARMMRGLGMISEDRGNLEKAEDYYRHALAIWEKTDPKGNNLAQGLFTVGIVVHERGDLAQAEQHYRRALAIWEKIVPDTTFVSQALERLGQLTADQSDLARAEEYYRRAIAIDQRRVPESPDLAAGLSGLGNVLLAKGQLAEALECHQRALAIRQKLTPGTDSHAASLAAMAGIMRRKGESDAAAQYYQQALDALEHQVTRLGGSNELRASFRANHAHYYKDYIDLLVDQKQFGLAFEVLERSRARSLLEMLAGAHIDVNNGVEPGILRLERQLQAEIAAKSDRRIRLLSEKHAEDQVAAVTKEIEDLVLKYQEVEDQLRTQSPSYAALTQPQPLSIKQVQEQQLDPNTLLLEYCLGEKRSYVWAVSSDSFALYEIANRIEIEEAARRLYKILTAWDEIHAGVTPAEAERQRNGRYRDTAALLSRMVLAPVGAELQGKRLIIVSDGALQYVPFAALPAPLKQESHARSSIRSWVPLSAEHEIVVLPSASVLPVLRAGRVGRQPASKAIAVFADPVFSSSDERVEKGAQHQQEGSAASSPLQRNSERLSRSMADVGVRGAAGALYLPRLLFTRREARAIMALAPKGQILEALDFDANLTKVTSQELQQYRVVHFATHGLVDSSHPELSGLVLSMVDRQGKPQDGFLGLQEIYNLNLPVDMVVLSACETGLGKEIESEGLIGLTRGFMYAGASRVVASLWKVNDAATAELMERFYKAIEQKGMLPAAALREAQKQLRKQKRWADPYYWAGFQIQGDWR